MSLLNKLERRYGRYAVPNLTIALISVQILVYVISYANREMLQALLLVPALVYEGQWWRLITFLAVPPVTNPIFAFFFWYLFYLMGSALEEHWGTFRYDVYLLIGYVATVAVSFLVPYAAATNAFLQGSVFLAFAFLYPDFQLYLFFILPVKIKWLAIIAGIGYFLTLVFGTWPARLMMLASLLNFLLFFADDIRYRIKTGRRQMEFQSKRWAGQARDEKQPFHRCTVCGVTDLTHPDMEFRYCPQCFESPGYCQDHLHNHQHIVAAGQA